MKSFRFAVQMSKAASPKQWRDAARKIEDLGYSTLFMPDHLDVQWAPLVALTAAAEATTRLRVGALVLDNDYRHPVLLAKELATLDLLSEGRLEAGIGAGWMTSDYEVAGIALDQPTMRVERLEEAIQVMKAMWRDGTCTFSGKHYRVHSAKGFPLPHRRPGPLLVIGGGSPRVLKLAAREADIVGVNPRLTSGVIGPETIASASPEEYDRRIAWVRDEPRARADDIELQCLAFFVHVGAGSASTLRGLASTLGMSPERVAAALVTLAGTIESIVETLQERRERWGFTYWVIRETEAHAQAEAFAPVVSRLAGT
jgi:probable F420-dependent oxidoreductase